jgi:uncharacterized alkaline shock family protein YloU
MVKNIDIDGYGAITISEDVIAACVRESVSQVDGVYDFFGGFPDALSQNILGKELKFRGIRVSEEEEGIVIDVQIIVEYGVKIPEVAWNLQRRIKTELEEVTGAVIKAVNIGVQSVHLKADKAVGNAECQAEGQTTR